MEKKTKDSKCERCKKPLITEEEGLCLKCKIDDYLCKVRPSATIYEFPSGRILKKGSNNT